jgi:predicted acylesterase/phospholipase RssA
VVAFVPLQPELTRSLVRNLADTLAIELGRCAPTTALTAGDDRTSWAGRLDNAEAANDVVLLVADETTGPWPSFCLRQADCVLGLMNPALGGPPGPLPSRCQLVSLGTSGLTTWLEALGTAPHHLIASGGDARLDVPRLARRVTGRSLGLVLSGGGARALAHVGVIDVFRRAGIPVDRVGGTSMGAFVSGLLAMGLDAAGMVELVRRELVVGRPFTDYVVPRHSLIRAEKATAMLQRVFGDARIEDKACSMFAISTDLVRAEQVVHRRGRIADAVGLSMRLPGFAPPRWVGERLHVDGGVVNNLPIEVMTAWAEGPVVAVDAMRPFIAGSRGADERNLPGIVDTIGRSMVLGSWQRAEHERALAATVISPSTGDVGMFDFSRLAEIVETGRTAAEEVLAGDAASRWFASPPSSPIPV